jgi:hypothetical protein
MVIHHFKFINGILAGLFIGSLTLTIWEVDVYEKTFIPLKIPLLVWIITGVVFTPFLRKKLSIYLMTTNLFLQMFYNIVTFGGLVISGFMLANFYFANKAETVINENIVSIGHLNSRSNCGRPFIIIDYNGQKKQLVYYCDMKVELYKTVDLTISQGLFGFDIVRNSEFKTK